METTLNAAEEATALLPTIDDVMAALGAWRPGSVALSVYTSSLTSSWFEAHDVGEQGMIVHLTDPLAQFPATRAALQRARGRESTYSQGPQLMGNWLLRFIVSWPTFEYGSRQLTALYEQIGSAGPTEEQRQAVLNALNDLIRLLGEQQLLLLPAELAYAATLAPLQEDEANLGNDVAGLQAAAATQEARLTDLVLQYTLNPTTRGLAPILQKGGQLQISQLRQTAAHLRQVVANCQQAHQAVAKLTGSLLHTLGRYRGLDAALRTAQGSSFRLHLQASRFNVALQHWQDLYGYVLKLMSQPE